MMQRPLRHLRHGRGFTLVELLVTIAVLVIVINLMLSLAGEVRQRSDDALTKHVLMQLEQVMARYSRQSGTQVPNLPPFVLSESERESNLLERAKTNNTQTLRMLTTFGGPFAELTALPEAVYSISSLRDAWGSPIVLMPRGHPAIGQAPQDRPFFVSAGRDRQYLTRDDNVYSYELADQRLR